MWRYKTRDEWELLIWELSRREWCETDITIWRRLDPRCRLNWDPYYKYQEWSDTIFYVGSEAWRMYPPGCGGVEVVAAGSMVTSLYLWQYKLTKVHMASPSVQTEMRAKVYHEDKVAVRRWASAFERRSRKRSFSTTTSSSPRWPLGRSGRGRVPV